MKRDFCLPILKHKKVDVWSMIQNHPDYQYYEVWIDYIEDLDDQFIEELVKKLGSKLIILFRRKLMEPVTMSFERRISIVYLLEKSQAYLDLDVIGQKEELNYILHKNIKLPLIVSYHNYKETPSNAEFSVILDKMSRYPATIYKISTFCNNEKDALRLMNLLFVFQEQNRKYIVLGMGEFGKITRVVGTLWGNEMIYAPITSAQESAPDQLTKIELETIFSILIK